MRLIVTPRLKTPLINLNKKILLQTLENKKHVMPGLNKTEQFLHENIAWKRLLEFFIQENIYLKTRLSQVVDREIDITFIAHAEHFQNEFILKDEIMHDIERDVRDQEKSLQLGLKQIGLPDHKTIKRQEKLRNEISYLEKEFLELKNQFNKYLLSNV